MEKELADCEPLTDDDFPDLTKEDYSRFCNRIPIIPENLRKWFDE